MVCLNFQIFIQCCRTLNSANWVYFCSLHKLQIHWFLRFLFVWNFVDHFLLKNNISKPHEIVVKYILFIYFRSRLFWFVWGFVLFDIVFWVQNLWLNLTHSVHEFMVCMHSVKSVYIFWLIFVYTFFFWVVLLALPSQLKIVIIIDYRNSIVENIMVDIRHVTYMYSFKYGWILSTLWFVFW